MSYDPFKEFEEFVRKIMEEMGFPKEFIEETLTTEFRPSLTSDLRSIIPPTIEKRLERPLYDIWDRGDKVEVCLDLKNFEAKTLEDLDYRIKGRGLFIRDRQTGMTYVLELPCFVDPKPEKVTYRNKVFNAIYPKAYFLQL